MQIISTIRNTFQFEPTTIDNFANWKIYRSDKYRFELKYPDIFVNRMRRQFILVSEKIIKMDNEKYHKFMKELMQRDTLFFV